MPETEILALWQKHESTMPSYVFHELYHFWQGLRLPFVHRYANRTLRGFQATVTWLKEEGVDLIAPEPIQDQSDTHLAMMWTESVPPLMSESLQAIYGSLTPLDLLEGAASLAEFQVLHDEAARVDRRVFDRWSKRNPSYTNALAILERRLRDGGFALRMFLPLVCQAFSTSDPARSFAELVELTRQIMPTQEELSSAQPRTWTDLARHLMHELPFDSEPDADRGYCRLLPSQMFRRPGHPIAGSLAREWEQRCWPDSAESPDYGLVMEMPGWIADHVLQYCRDRFGPPFTIVRFHWVQGRKSVHIYGGENSGSTGIDEDLIVELLTTYGLLRRRTGLHYDPQTRLCHHSSCPYYEANWCNTFPFVPNDYSECTFSSYVLALTKLVRNGKDTNERS